jgi:hypothetical protein
MYLPNTLAAELSNQSLLTIKFPRSGREQAIIAVATDHAPVDGWNGPVEAHLCGEEKVELAAPRPPAAIFSFSFDRPIWE